ncbi:MAG: hypothetical protein ACFE0O_04810 [Opitutales bacterium]
MANIDPGSVHFYPTSIEGDWLATCEAATGSRDQRAAITQLEPEVRALTDLFTDRRPEHYVPYLQDPRRLAAYGLYHFPRNWTRVRFPLADWLDWFGGPVRPETGRLRLLDLGSGPGPAGLSAAQFLLARGCTDRIGLTLLDHSQSALKRGRELARTHLPAVDVRTAVRSLDQPGAANNNKDPYWDGIILSFAANEWADTADPEALWKQIEPWAGHLSRRGWLLLLDVARETVSRSIEQVRQRLLASPQWQVLGPDRFDAPHPLAEHGKRWPHEVRPWSPPDSLRELNRIAWRNLDTLKFSYLLMARGDRKAQPEAEPVTAAESGWRLISPVGRRKGVLLWHMVDADGQATQAEIQTRELDAPAKKRVLAWQRGDRLRLDPKQCEHRGDRLRLLGETAIVRYYQPA